MDIDIKKEYRIEIDPMGKPRMTQRDKWKKRPVVERYRSFCDMLRWECKSVGFELGPELSCQFILPMPKSWSKKKKAEHLGKPHQQRPDIDNMCKSVMDALAKEDSYVHSLQCTKTWGTKGMIIFEQSNIE